MGRASGHAGYASHGTPPVEQWWEIPIFTAPPGGDGLTHGRWRSQSYEHSQVWKNFSL